MRIAVLPYSVPVSAAVHEMPASSLRWLEGTGAHETDLGDLGPDDHLIVYPRRRTVLGSFTGLKCKVSILLSEPWLLSRRIYLPMLLLWPKFHRVFTFQPLLLRLIPNSRKWIAANSWVGTPNIDLRSPRLGGISLVASAKMLLPGHRLRHAIARWVRAEKLDVDLLGLAYKPLKHKIDGLLPYRFSVVIENSRERGYFTEKLIDALLCGTVPIYWGAPDVADYFDPAGMIVCKTEADIRAAILRADEALYSSMHDAIERNRAAALSFTDYERNAAEIILRENRGEGRV